MQMWVRLAATFILAMLIPALNLHAQIPAADLQNKAILQKERQIFSPHYSTLIETRHRELEKLEQVVMTREQKMQDVSCSHQIVTELGWLMGSTVDIARIDARLADLRASLAHPELEARARAQDSDGSWGHCYDAWFFRLDASYDGHFSRDEGGSHIPLLDRINSPSKLTEYVNSISVSDVSHDGENHRREMNEALATLIRLILRGQPRAYHWDPAMKSTLLDLLKQIRNPDTGWWGERYRRDGRVDYVDDMSITFHIVSYLDGDLPDLDKVAATLLQLKDSEYPIGWLADGKYLTHHSMDVVVLFRYAWPHMNADQRRAASTEIEKMLRWCLQDSVLPDGSFRASTGGEDSLEENEYFGVAFLARAGYFDQDKRFWTSESFPEAQALRLQLIDFIQQHKASGAAGGAYYQNALRELGVSTGN
jgi:hypothetical protein